MTRVVSMVPSWTETLLWAGVNVVGRTKFCVHPADVVNSIPKVGGTKDWNEGKVRAALPDLLILDREENPRWMSEQPSLPYWASDITELSSLPKTLVELAELLGNSALAELARRWRRVCEQPDLPLPGLDDAWPGVIEWGRRPRVPSRDIVYVIWRGPWMAVGPQTFIASVLRKLGLSVAPNEERYPIVDLGQISAETTLLFSSEPFPFLHRRKGLDKLPNPYAYVNGESFSWFGIRSLNFLEQALGLSDS